MTDELRGKALIASFNKKTSAGIREKNILQWTKHCDNVERRAQEGGIELTQEQQDDIAYRRMQVKRWQSEV